MGGGRIPVGGASLSPLAVVFLFVLLPFASSSPSPQIEILSAERRIDLTSHIIRMSLTLKVENTGASHADEILIAFPPTQAEHLALIKASLVQGKRKKKTHIELPVKSSVLSDTTNGSSLFSISLSKPLDRGETATLEVLLILTNSLEPFPAEISQSESQLVYYRDSALILSPYNVREQVTYLRTPTSKVESHTRVEPTSRAGTELKYGPYVDQLPYSSAPMMVHFENNHPFVVVEELVREVIVSHWGSIQVTEHYQLVNAGAKLNGIFSRVEYQSRPSFSGLSSFRHLLARLPPRVHSVYYRDEIGNISSSHLRGDSSKSELEIEPRYPLFGGWRASFIIGYSLPLQDFNFNLFDSSEGFEGRFYLNFSFGCPLVETVVKKLTIKVVLPEGSKEASAMVPFPVEKWLETKYSSLDVMGSTVVVLKRENVVPEHNVPFQVYYSFNLFYTLAKPVMLSLAFFFFFVAYIAYVHLDLSIRK